MEYLYDWYSVLVERFKFGADLPFKKRNISAKMPQFSLVGRLESIRGTACIGHFAWLKNLGCLALLADIFLTSNQLRERIFRPDKGTLKMGIGGFSMGLSLGFNSQGW